MAVTWPDERMAALDTETTGVDPHEDRIVTCALCLVGGKDAAGGKLPTKGKTWIVDPKVEIPEGATKVHGITTERARAEGMDAAEAVQEIVRLVAKFVARGVPLVVFNARYDLTLLDAEARRHSLGPLVWPDAPLRVIDPLVLDKHVDRYRRGSRRLEAMCEHYDARIAGAHDSTHDALAAARVAWRIGKRYPEVGEMDLAALHEKQVAWAAEQAAGLEAHKRANGDPGAVIEREWPIVTAKVAA